MTVSSSNNRNAYTASASQTVFAYTFNILDQAHIAVYVDDVLQTITTHYTVDGIDSGSGGNVTFVTPMTGGESVVFVRDIDILQETDYTAYDAFPAETHEDALDLLTMVDQQQQETMDRKPSLPPSYNGGEIVMPSIEGDGFWKWNAAGTGIEWYALADIESAESNSIASAAAAAVSESNAAASEANAATSESNAATSASNASTSESNASTSETNASTSASNASTSETNAAASEAAALNYKNQIQNSLIPFSYNAVTTIANPGVGLMRMNSVTLSSVTQMAFSDFQQSSGNPDVSAYINAWGDSESLTNKGYLVLKVADNVSIFGIYKITALTDNSGWSQITVTHVASNGSFTSNDELMVWFAQTGDGDTGPSGADGATILVVADSATLVGGYGSDGDSALVLNATSENGDWYSKSGGAWALRGNVEGPVNPQDGEPNGFVDYAGEVTIGWDNGTRTLSVTPVSGTYNFYSNGTKYTKGAETFQIADTDGEHLIYFDDDGNLAEAAAFEPNIIERWCFVAFVYWDSAAVAAVPDAIIETHGASMSSVTHSYLHNTQGTKYDNGLLVTVTADGGGSLDAHAQFAGASGVIWDEDILHNISTHALTDTLPKLYKDGASGVWKSDGTDSFVVKTTGTGRAAWNEWTGATWQLTELTNNDFVLMHLFAIPGFTEKWAIVMGQADYANAAAARAGALGEVLSLDLTGFPFSEGVLVATLIVQSSNSYTNTPKSQIITTDTGDDYVSWLTVPLLSGSTGGVGDGDVTGPATSTDNALARFDTTTGKLLQDSVVVVDDSGNISGVGTVDGRTISTDGAKLDLIEALATADQTGAEIKVKYEAEANTNAFTDAEKTKLGNITAFGSSLIDDVDAAAARTTLSVDVAGTDNAPAASESTAGKIEIATTAEINTGTDTVRAMAPDQYQGSNRNLRYATMYAFDPTTDVETGTSLAQWVAPFAGTIIQNDSARDQFAAYTTTAGTTGTMVVDIHKNGTTIMSTNKLDIETGEADTTTATTQPDLTTTTFVAGDVFTLDIDAIHTTPAKGLHVTMTVRPT